MYALKKHNNCLFDTDRERSRERERERARRANERLPIHWFPSPNSFSEKRACAMAKMKGLEHFWVLYMVGKNVLSYVITVASRKLH